MHKARVLFLVLQLDAGGAERVVFDLARGLDPEKFEVFVAAFKAGVLAKQLEMICMDVFIIEKKNGLDISAMFKLSKIIKKNRIDIVNAHHYMPCFYSFLGTRIFNGKRLVYTEHSVPEVESIVSSIHGKILHWMLYRINAVVGISRAITEKFREKYPCHLSKFHEILNGVDIEMFEKKGAREKVRSRWGVPEECFVVGTVANFRNIKNHVCLVRAAGRLSHSHPQLRLFFVGTGFPGDPENSEDAVRVLIRDLGLQDSVVLTGYQENIPEILTAFDAFCLPSFSEGLPISVLEAMAAGVPVIGSEVNGILEVVTHRQTGLLFPSDDDKQLSFLIKEIMAAPNFSKTLAIKGCNYIKNAHSNRDWQKKYERIFAE